MKFYTLALSFAGCLLFNCSGPPSDPAISGAYAREYKYEQRHAFEDRVVGTVTIRDTIFIKRIDGGYEISNKKWRLNDYDGEGWTDQAHADNRPMPVSKASFSPGENILTGEGLDRSIRLHLDLEKQVLYKNNQQQEPYTKIRQ